MSELADRLDVHTAAEPRVDGGLATVIALLWAAGLIHVVAAIAHLQEYALYAVFFEALAAAQVIWGVALYRAPSRRLLWTAAVGSLAVVALWAISRTTGLPIGPNPWTPEPVGALDAVCSADELALAVLVYCRIGLGTGGPGRRAVATLATGASLFLILLSSLVLVSGGHAH